MYTYLLTVLCCAGNHEYYTGDVDNWIAEMSKLSVTPLVNQRVCLPLTMKKSCAEGLYLAGLEDLATRTLKCVIILMMFISS